MAVDMFMDLKGVTGESQDSKHKGQIDVLAWSWGASNSGTFHMGGGGGSGKANVQDISFTKYVDLSTTTLWEGCMMGKHYDSATLTCRKAGGTNPVDFLVIVMTDVLITSVTTGGSGGEDRLTENVSVNFAKVQVTYTEQSKTGAKGATPTFTYNIASNEAA